MCLSPCGQIRTNHSLPASFQSIAPNAVSLLELDTRPHPLNSTASTGWKWDQSGRTEEKKTKQGLSLVGQLVRLAAPSHRSPIGRRHAAKQMVGHYSKFFLPPTNPPGVTRGSTRVNPPSLHIILHRHQQAMQSVITIMAMMMMIGLTSEFNSGIDFLLFVNLQKILWIVWNVVYRRLYLVFC